MRAYNSESQVRLDAIVKSGSGRLSPAEP